MVKEAHFHIGDYYFVEERGHGRLEVAAIVGGIVRLQFLAGVVKEAEEGHRHLLTNFAENIAEGWHLV